MRVVVLVVVCGLIIGQDGENVEASLSGRNSPQRTHATGSVHSALKRQTAGELLLEDSNPCFSLREKDDQRQLLCNDRRSKFNFNPFGLRFGKRYDSYIYRRAVQKARTNNFTPLFPSSPELDVPT